MLHPVSIEEQYVERIYYLSPTALRKQLKIADYLPRMR